MHTYLKAALVMLFATPLFSQWQPKGENLKTIWADKIDINNIHSEYPRPILERKDWINLNGLWDFDIVIKDQPKPDKLAHKILVPFPIESSLSGVMQSVGKDNEAWYQRRFTVPSSWKGKNILLHFGAVDWKSEIWLNGIKIASHEGGYNSFSVDITPYLNSVEQTLSVLVWDPTSDGPQPRGKQVKDPRGIWYTPVTGIWQTVWLEPVTRSHISDLKITPDVDRSRIKIQSILKHTEYGDLIKVNVLDKSAIIASETAAGTEEMDIHIKNPKLWSPENPHLYDLNVQLIRGGKIIDEIKSYSAMRKISMKRDENGIMRMQLNNKDYFHYGTLDQGWWPDGLYTAPSDEALRYDIVKTKDFGFNMIRKHVKVEPQRWYYHCDKIGMLVWQDMPNGDRNDGWQMRTMFEGNENVRSPSSEKIYRKEWKAIIDMLYSYPSIVVWVPFNEGWGQFKTKEITEWTMQYDPTRLVNSASGGNHFKTGHILDVHNYPAPEMYLYDADRVTVLGEYGGIGLPIDGHLWQKDRNWGYIQFKNSAEVTDEYIKYAEKLKKMVKSGFSGAIYTQTTDVEGEVNGLMTYDRKVDKLEVARVKKINEEVINALNNK
ncbi:MAG TPA: glycoside hydrolase family 2 TIM barrel-domain containing protein [Saprospiraceae bacterium]|nr:glycoside hydrolase family 2 TIM barrel-domain containing protein [Saprospiraceae bacterium]